MNGDRIPGPLNDQVDEETRRREELDKKAYGVDAEGKSLGTDLRHLMNGQLEEFSRLDDVAGEVFKRNRSDFLVTYADAWLHADVYDKRLMRPVWESFIRKYNLLEDPEGTGARKSRGDP